MPIRHSKNSELESNSIHSLASRAESLMHEGNWQQAAILCTLLRDKFPTHVVGYLGGGIALLESGNLCGAEELFYRAMELYPGDVWTFNHYSEVAMRRSDWEEASRRWSVVRSKFPGHAPGYVRGGVALLESGNLGGAEELFNRAMELCPDDVWAFHYYSEVAMRRSDWKEASRRWSVVRSKFPGHAPGYMRDGVALLENGNLRDAEEMFYRAMELCPGDVWAFHYYSEIAMRRSDWEEASRRWSVVRSKFPDHAPGYMRGGVALFENSDLRGAEEMFSRAMELCPGDVWAFHHYSEVAMRRSDWEEASRRWSVVRSKFPDHAPGYVRGGVALLESDDLGGAEELLSRATKLCPDDVWAFHHYSEAAMRRWDWEEASRRGVLLHEKFPNHQSYAKAWVPALDVVFSENQEAIYTIIFSGLIRTPERIDELISFVNARKNTKLRCIISTWESEFDKHLQLLNKAMDNGIIVLSSMEPRLVGYGHIAQQQLSLINALELVEKNSPVLRSRFDFYNEYVMLDFLAHNFAEETEKNQFRVFKSKMMIIGNFVWQPFYINDFHYAGLKEDFLKLISCPLFFPYTYSKLSTEQLLYLPAFINNSQVLNIFFKSNIGIVCANPRRARMLTAEKFKYRTFLSSIAMFFKYLESNFVYFCDEKSKNKEHQGNYVKEDLLFGHPSLGTVMHPYADEICVSSFSIIDAIKQYSAGEDSLKFLSKMLSATSPNEIDNVDQADLCSFLKFTKCVYDHNFLGKADSLLYTKRFTENWTLVDDIDKAHDLANLNSVINRTVSS